MLLKSIALKNFLSFGDEQTLELRPMNVMIGANGSGKSNLIECLNLLRADSGFVRKAVDAGWIWNRAETPSSTRSASAHLSATLSLPKHDGEAWYNLSFSEDAGRPGSPAVYDGVEHDGDKDIGEGRS